MVKNGSEEVAYKQALYVPKTVFEFGPKNWSPVRILFNGRTFFFIIHRGSMGKWSHWVYLLGNQQAADKYTFTVKINDKDAIEGMNFTSKVISVDCPREKILDSKATNFYNDPGLAMTHSDAIARKFMRKMGGPIFDTGFEYTLTIRPCKYSTF